MIQLLGGGHRCTRSKYWRWPLSFFVISGTLPGRTYPTPTGGFVHIPEISPGGQQRRPVRGPRPAAVRRASDARAPRHRRSRAMEGERAAALCTAAVLWTAWGAASGVRDDSAQRRRALRESPPLLPPCQCLSSVASHETVGEAAGQELSSLNMWAALSVARGRQSPAGHQTRGAAGGGVRGGVRRHR